jgi:hypothetical protein
MDYRLNPGSGGGDVTVLIPDAAFAGKTGYLYLYSKFGGAWGANAGFEEWAVRKGAACPEPPPPPVGLASLSGKVVLDANDDQTIDPSDAPFVGMVVELYNSAGTRVATTITGNDGSYSFTNLPAGSYTVQMVVPGDSFVTMFPEIGGVAGGTPEGQVLSTWVGVTSIDLAAGDAAAGYNLGVWAAGV